MTESNKLDDNELNGDGISAMLCLGVILLLFITLGFHRFVIPAKEHISDLYDQKFSGPLPSTYLISGAYFSHNIYFQNGTSLPVKQMFMDLIEARQLPEAIKKCKENRKYFKDVEITHGKEFSKGEDHREIYRFAAWERMEIIR